MGNCHGLVCSVVKDFKSSGHVFDVEDLHPVGGVQECQADPERPINCFCKGRIGQGTYCRVFATSLLLPLNCQDRCRRAKELPESLREWGRLFAGACSDRVHSLSRISI